VNVTCRSELLDPVELAEGARIVVRARPEYYYARGTLSLRAGEIRPVGVGELLARLERLKRMLHAEGLFDPARKRPLPFLPNVVRRRQAGGSRCRRAAVAAGDMGPPDAPQCSQLSEC